MRYREFNEERKCRTPGTMFNTQVTSRAINVAVELPPEVKIPNMTDDQVAELDDEIHDAMEKIVADLIDDLDPDAKKKWAKARTNDKEELDEKMLDLPLIKVGDPILIGKFKNRKANITGMKYDEKDQPVLKTSKGDQKLFKSRLVNVRKPKRS